MNRQWRLVGRPSGVAKSTDFEFAESVIPALKDGEALVRVEMLSMDPTNRLWLYDQPTYIPPQELGEVVRGLGIGTVVESKIELPGAPLNWHLGPFGMHGMTAYFGLMDVGKLQQGETLLVSAAAGAVGSLVGQIGKIQGCRVIGIAGTDDKCHWITNDLGFDDAINYRKEKSMSEAVARTCPNGVDVYFDNVGGAILEAALQQINLHGRIVVCGMISCYNESTGHGFDLHPPRNLLRLLYQRARMEGFLVSDYFHRAKEAITSMIKWSQEGHIKYRFHVDHGLENAPATMNKLFTGEHDGKLILQIT